MKKILALLSLIVCAFLPISCSCNKEPTISTSQSEIVLALNETFDLDSIITTENAEHGYETIIRNKTIASVEGNVITPLTSGETTLKCRILGYEDTLVTINLIIRDVYLAKSVTIPKSEVVINMGYGKSAINKPQFTEKVTEIPVVVCDNNIVSYDYMTGTISARNIGETTIKIIYEKCRVEFKVKVQDTIYVESMDMVDMTLYVNDSDRFSPIIYPTNGNQYRFYTHSDKIEVDSFGYYNAKSDGVATIYYEYYTDMNAEVRVGEFNVTIYPLPDDLAFSIINCENNSVSYIFKDETNKLVFDLKSSDRLSNFRYSSNIEVVSDDISEDSNGKKFVLFKAKNTGNISISVSCDILLDGVVRGLTYTVNIFVYDYSDIETCIKGSIYTLVPDEDGVYRLQLSTGFESIAFWAGLKDLGDNILGDSIKVYLLQDEKVEVSNTFELRKGTFTFVIEYDSHEIERYVVIVS